jgi:ribosomal protein S18 acetylase RimI-like enzyme
MKIRLARELDEEFIKEIAVKNEFKGMGYAKALFNHAKKPLYLT